jgi:hypothetical protein
MSSINYFKLRKPVYISQIITLFTLYTLSYRELQAGHYTSREVFLETVNTSLICSKPKSAGEGSPKRLE